MSKVKARVKVPKSAAMNEVIEVKTLISHPMHSGRSVDSDGNTVPRNIINNFTAKFNGRLYLMSPCGHLYHQIRF
jgi:sulfur-oxidizing protein SoxZ